MMAKYISIVEAVHVKAEILQNKCNHFIIYGVLGMLSGKNLGKDNFYLFLKNNNKKTPTILSNNYVLQPERLS